MKTNRYIIVFVTARNKAEGRMIANGLLEDKLIACANLIKGVESFFCWKGKVDRSKEVMLVIKTQQELFSQVVAKVKKLHSYETPEIIAFPIVAGDKAYLKWIDESVS